MTIDLLKKPTEELVVNIWSATTKLNDLWNKVHMDENSRKSRINHAYNNLNKYLNDIINSETEMVNAVIFDISARRENIAELRKIFQMPVFDESNYKSNSIELLKALDVDLNLLRNKKEKIIEKQKNIYNKYLRLCERLGEQIISLEGYSENILDESQLNLIQDEIVKLEDINTKRYQLISKLQLECLKINDILSHCANLEQEETIMLKTNYTLLDVPLTENLIQNFMLLEQKLKDQYDEWIEAVAFRYDELLIKMEDLSKKCFNQNYNAMTKTHFNPHLQGEKDVQELEEKVKALEKKYELGKPVFDKLNEWMNLWREKLNAERRVCRTSFYKNRGCALSASLKRQKQVCQQVPKVFKELKDVVQNFVKIYGADDILVEDMLPDQYAEFVMEGYKRDKEIEKAQKQILKKAGGKENLNSRNFYGTCMKSSQTLISPAPSSMSTNSRKRSFSCSQLSLISPTKPVSHEFPLTSSPKTQRLSPSSSLNKTKIKTPRITPSKAISSAMSKKPPLGVCKTPTKPWY